MHYFKKRKINNEFPTKLNAKRLTQITIENLMKKRYISWLVMIEDEKYLKSIIQT